MKKFYLSAGILLIAIFVRAQQPFTPHVVFDNNNKVYAVKASPSSFLKFIDSTGQILDQTRYQRKGLCRKRSHSQTGSSRSGNHL